MSLEKATPRMKVEEGTQSLKGSVWEAFETVDGKGWMAFQNGNGDVDTLAKRHIKVVTRRMR